VIFPFLKKVSPSIESVSKPTPPTKASKGPSSGDWLGLTDGASTTLGTDEIQAPSGDAGRRPRTAAGETTSRPENRPKTAAPAAQKPRQGQGDALKTPKDILQSFINDYGKILMHYFFQYHPVHSLISVCSKFIYTKVSNAP